MFEFATKFIVDPNKWLTTVWEQVTASKLPEIVQGLAIALLILGAIWSGLRIASLGASSELQSFMVRLLLASAIVFGGVQIGNEVRGLWRMGYTWGSANFTEKTTELANEELTNLRNTMVGLSAGVLAAPIIIEGGKTILGKDRGEAMKDAKEGVINNGNMILELIKYVIGGLAAIITTDYMVVIVTGFAVIVASILVPLSGVMVLFPGPAMQMWFSMWFRATSGAVLVVMLSPIAFSAALTLGFIEPAKNYNAALSKSAEQFKSATDLLGSFTPSGSLNPADAVKYLQTVGPRLTEASQQIGNSLGTLSFGLISSVIMLFVGIAFAVLLIFAAQSQIIAFVGGAAGGGGRGQSLTPLAAAAGFAGGGLATTVGAGGGSAGAGGSSPNKTPSRPDSSPSSANGDNGGAGSGGGGGSRSGGGGTGNGGGGAGGFNQRPTNSPNATAPNPKPTGGSTAPAPNGAIAGEAEEAAVLLI